LDTRTILAVINWCFLPYALLVPLTPGCQIGYVDDTGCLRLVQNDVQVATPTSRTM
jgi:hypothetical protein